MRRCKNCFVFEIYDADELGENWLVLLFPEQDY
jgi:hypothetical protein